MNGLQKYELNNSFKQIDGKLLEKVILNNDLSGLSPIEKVNYVKRLCESLDLNLVTKPIQIMKFQNKEVPYFTKDASEQLRKNNRVSITKMETKILEGGLYVVTAYATMPDGRQDCSTGAIVINGLKGDALANAMMKAETKAKRRVTLSICGLGFIDETEVDSLPNVKKIDFSQLDKEPESMDIEPFLIKINSCDNLGELKLIFDEAKFNCFRRNPDLFNRLVEAKDKRKSELLYEVSLGDFSDKNIDLETGEITR